MSKLLLQSPIGVLRISSKGGVVEHIEFLGTSKTSLPNGEVAPFLRELRGRFEDYFQGACSMADIPRMQQGTQFQQRVWLALGEIPVGEVVTYGELARHLGSGARAVGAACRVNPTPLIVPCHRVVSSSGIGGFSGETGGDMLGIKRWLLQHEGASLPAQ